MLILKNKSNDDMNIELEKQQIVEELRHRNEEWLIIAMKKLLGLDDGDKFSSEHRAIIEERIKLYETRPDDVITLEQLVQELKAENRL